MRLASKTTIGVAALLLCACEMKAPRAKAPAPPQPAAAKAEPPPEPGPSEPLSIPQTQVRLPSPQPLNPEAVVSPPLSAPAGKSAASTAGRPKRPPTPPTAAPSKPEAVETAEAPASATEAPPRRIEPVLPDEQRRRLNEDIVSRLREVDQLLGRIAARTLSDKEKESVERIRSFKDLSFQALERGDTQQANGLADRALLLAKEMLRGR
jgi:hypothetical protein